MFYKYKLSRLFAVLLILSFAIGCEAPEDEFFFDVENQDDAIAQFQASPVLVINPSANTDNTVSVGVSTVSNTDRSFQVSISEDSSLDASFFDIPSLTGVIPAGEFVGSITVTTLQTNVFPAMGSSLVLDLDSVDGANLLDSSTTQVSLGFTVECPSVDISQIVGTAVTTNNTLLAAFGLAVTAADPRQVVQGPGENQVTIVGGFGVGSSEDVILNIDPSTGDITDGSPEGTLIFVNGGANPTPVPITGLSGRALTCINEISFSANNAIFGGALSSFTLTLSITPN
jgi:hypothetical protein